MCSQKSCQFERMMLLCRISHWKKKRTSLRDEEKETYNQSNYISIPDSNKSWKWFVPLNNFFLFIILNKRKNQSAFYHHNEEKFSFWCDIYAMYKNQNEWQNGFPPTTTPDVIFCRILLHSCNIYKWFFLIYHHLLIITIFIIEMFHIKCHVNDETNGTKMWNIFFFMIFMSFVHNSMLKTIASFIISVPYKMAWWVTMSFIVLHVRHDISVCNVHLCSLTILVFHFIFVAYTNRVSTQFRDRQKFIVQYYVLTIFNLVV